MVTRTFMSVIDALAKSAAFFNLMFVIIGLIFINLNKEIYFLNNSGWDNLENTIIS